MIQLLVLLLRRQLGRSKTAKGESREPVLQGKGKSPERKHKHVQAKTRVYSEVEALGSPAVVVSSSAQRGRAESERD